MLEDMMVHIWFALISPNEIYCIYWSIGRKKSIYNKQPSFSIDKFRSNQRKLRYQFHLAWNKIIYSRWSMRGWSGGRVFGLKNFSLYEIFLFICLCNNILVMSTPKPDLFSKLFWAFVGVYEFFIKFTPRTFLRFFPVLFFWYYWPKIQIVPKSHIFNKSNLLTHKNWKQN